MDIEGLGIKVAEQLVAEGRVKDVADLYRLTAEDLLSLEGFAVRRAENLVRAIDASRAQSLARLINALGIRGVGETVAADLAAHFGDLGSLAVSSREQIEAVPGIGPETAGRSLDGLRNLATASCSEAACRPGLASRLRRQAAASRQTLRGLTFVLSGTLPDLSRQDAKSLIEKAGGKVAGSVSARTDFLVLGEEPGSKLERARALGVKTIGSAELQRLIRQG
jgi:DNA ligase (NAD+)